MADEGGNILGVVVSSLNDAAVLEDTLSDETRKALGLRTRTMEAAYEAEQVKNGLVKSGDDWVTPEEKKRRETPFLIYADKPRNEAWFNAQYEKFKSNIIHAEGKFKDIGPATLRKPSPVTKESPAEGTEIRYIAYSVPYRYNFVSQGQNRSVWYVSDGESAKVMQVIDEKSCLLSINRYSTSPGYTTSGGGPSWDGNTTSFVCTIRLTECDTSKMTDGTMLAGFEEKPFVFLGNYRYETANGSNTVQNYAPLRPLTKDEFKQCLQDGFKLVEYTSGPKGAVGNPVP
jgi:hypothetical protein